MTDISPGTPCSNRSALQRVPVIGTQATADVHQGAAILLQIRRRIQGRSRNHASITRKTLAPQEPSTQGPRTMASVPAFGSTCAKDGKLLHSPA
jgi:hypothetical protein